MLVFAQGSTHRTSSDARSCHGDLRNRASCRRCVQLDGATGQPDSHAKPGSHISCQPRPDPVADWHDSSFERLADSDGQPDWQRRAERDADAHARPAVGRDALRAGRQLLVDARIDPAE